MVRAVRKKQSPPLKIKLDLLPEVLSDGYTFDAFSELIQRQDLNRLEKILGISSPSDGFREWLIPVFWRFYCNSEPRVWNSRALLKNELRNAARLATKLKECSDLLWRSPELSVIENLHDLVAWQDWQLSGPMHKSGVPWIALLDEFANRAIWLAQALPNDKGGPRQAIAFDELLVGLADYYRAWARKYDQQLNEDQFFQFAEAVTDTLRKVRPQLPDAASLRLPPAKGALRKRLLRLNKKVLPAADRLASTGARDKTASFFGQVMSRANRASK